MRTRPTSLVSVIVPCHNYDKFLPDVLNSVMLQSYKEWECIVVDDGSTDSTKAVVEKFAQIDGRFKYRYQLNKGMSSARNHALRVARGTLIQFVDADDLIDTEKLKKHACYLGSNPDVDLVYGDWDYFSTLGAKGNPVRVVPTLVPWKPKTSGRGRDICRKLITGNIFTISAPLVRKSLIDRICGFDEALRLHEDWDLWMRCALTGGNIHYLDAPDTMTLIRLHPHSVSRDRAGMYRTAVELRGKIQSRLSDPSLQAFNTQLMGCARIHVGINEVKRGSLVEGCRQLIAGLRQGGSSELWKLVLARIIAAHKAMLSE